MGLGANLGDREATLRSALEAIARLGAIERVSSVYETAPVGHADQPDFWNLALALRTELEPAALLTALHAIEAEHGRVRTFRNAPRTLDIDILLYDDRVIDEPGLKVPHPRMHERAFVMKPLAEIGGTVKHSILQREIADLANAIEPDGIRRLFDGARLI